MVNYRARKETTSERVVNTVGAATIFVIVVARLPGVFHVYARSNIEDYAILLSAYTWKARQ